VPRVSPSVQRITVTLLERLTENSLVNFGHLEVLSRLHAVGYGVVSCGGRSWPHVCVQMRPERFWGLGNVRCKWVNWTHCRPLGTSLERRWNPLSDGLRPVPRDIYIHAYIHILFLQNGMAYKTRSIWKNVGPIRHWEPLHAALPFTRCHRLRIDVHNNNDDDDDDDNDNAWQRGPLWPHRMGPKMVQKQVYRARRARLKEQLLSLQQQTGKHKLKQINQSINLLAHKTARETTSKIQVLRARRTMADSTGALTVTSEIKRKFTRIYIIYTRFMHQAALIICCAFMLKHNRPANLILVQSNNVLWNKLSHSQNFVMKVANQLIAKGH